MYQDSFIENSIWEFYFYVCVTVQLMFLFRDLEGFTLCFIN